MKIRVISEFYDKFHTSTLFRVGTVLDFDDDRAKDIIAKKLAVSCEEPKAKEEAAAETKAVTEPKEENHSEAEAKEEVAPEAEQKAEHRGPGRPKMK